LFCGGTTLGLENFFEQEKMSYPLAKKKSIPPVTVLRLSPQLAATLVGILGVAATGYSLKDVV